MKKAIVFLFAMLFIGFAQSCQAGMFFDDFNDGNVDGWTAIVGNWRVEDNMLKQDLPGDGRIFLVDNLSISNQTVEVKALFHDYAGNGGIIIWYQDSNNWTSVLAYPTAGPATTVWVIEKIDGTSQISKYPYSFRNEAWYKIGVNANSTTGEIEVSIDDIYLFTHDVVTQNRVGLSGLLSGNNGGYFDDFKLASEDIVPAVPSDKNYCKKYGWKLFRNPTFKNQGDCVSYVESNKKSGKK